MKLVNKKEFLEMPNDTLYCLYTDDDSEPDFRLKIKTSNFGDNDYIYNPLVDIGCGYEYDIEYTDALDKLDNGDNVDIDTYNTTGASDYDDDGEFIIFSIQDIEKIYTRLGEVLESLKK